MRLQLAAIAGFADFPFSQNLRKRAVQSAMCTAAAAFALSCIAQEPSARLHGVVRDQNGGAIPGARLAAVCDRGAVDTSTAKADGSYVLNLPAGAKCVVHATAKNFAEDTLTEPPTAAGSEANFTLRIQTQAAEVVVHADEEPLVSADPASNVGAIVLGKQELELLPDDPDDLMQDLLAMAGPSPPGGAQLYTDGFTAQKLPPKSAIREIKINQDPYSAQYDHVDLGRIEILTKPGSNPVHGQFAYRFSDAALSSRNPFARTQAPYWAQLVTGSMGGPLTRKLSYIGDFQDWIAKGNAVVDAQVLDAGFAPTILRQTLPVPEQNLSTGGRLDYQATQNTTLTVRFEYTRDSATGRGPGGFSLGSDAYNIVAPGENVQISATSALNPTTLNQLRFQYLQESVSQTPKSTAPSLLVLDSFTAGGAAAGAFSQKQALYEIQDYVTKSLGAHTLMAGGQMRFLSFQNAAPTNFNGQFVFSGGNAPMLDANFLPAMSSNGTPIMERISSLERYRRTLALQAMGMTPAQIRTLGGGASQYTVATGSPLAAVLQFDFGAFVQDD